MTEEDLQFVAAQVDKIIKSGSGSEKELMNIERLLRMLVFYFYL